MKRISIPRVEALDSLSEPESIIEVLDDRGTLGAIECANWPDESQSRPKASFAIAHSGHKLYIDFRVRCNYLLAEHSHDQDPVSQDSCVEVFMQPEKDGEYWNFEFNCIGFLNASHRLVRPNPTRLNESELAQVLRFPSCGNRPFKEIEGVFTWNILVVIPLSLMNFDNPAPGTVIRGNFYKCASGASVPHYLSWNPITTEKPDFHRPEFFGELVFE
ncbi:MAG: hypothetical protein HDS65_08875 [Bacteroidales bacterium]|nr:hypothetical protein [Bacteroidales bacterium]